MRNERGFALVLTLVITALMVAVTAELIHQVYVDTTLSRSFRDGQQASLLAESGIDGGIKLLQLSLAGHQDYSSLSDSWATPFKVDDESGSLEISASEESGKIDLNGLVSSSNQPTDFTDFTQKALTRLGDRLQIPKDVWDSLADWLDSDDQRRSGGAETPYYQSLKPPYRARNGRLATFEELSLVKGFSPEIVAKLKPFVTVYSDGSVFSKININTAPLEVIAALNERINDGMAERVLEKRRLQPFKSVSELGDISGFAALGSQLQGFATQKGSIFRITSVAKVKDTARAVEAVVRLGGTAADILAWREY